MKNTNKKSISKPRINIYAWTHKNKKNIAGVICIILVLAMIVGLLC